MRPFIKPFIAGLFTAGALLGGVAAWSEGDLSAPIQALHGHHGDPAAHEAMMRSMAIRHLDLDAAQTARLDTVIAQLKAQHAAMHGAGDFHAQVATLVQGNSFDRAGAQALLQAHLQQMRDAGPGVITAVGDFYDGLRPDQQQKLRDFMASHHGMSHDGARGHAPASH